MASRAVNTGGNSAFKYFALSLGLMAVIGLTVYFVVTGQNKDEEQKIKESEQQLYQDIIEHRENSSEIDLGNYNGVLKDNNEVVIASKKEDELVVEIPAYVDGLMTTTIGEGLYAGTNIEAVIIPDGVERIEADCFRGCKNLKTVTMPQSLTYIGARAFDGCESLTSITVPPGVSYLGAGCFANCKNLSSLTVPPYLETIEEDTFRNTAITSVKLETTYKVKAHAFTDCPNLTIVTIRALTEEIDSTCFDGSENVVIRTTENSPAWKFAIENNINVVKGTTD